MKRILLVLFIFIVPTLVLGDYINKEGYYVIKNKYGETIKRDTGIFKQNNNGWFENSTGTEYSVGPDLGNGKREVLSVVNFEPPVTMTRWLITEFIIFAALIFLLIKIYKKVRRDFSPRYKKES